MFFENFIFFLRRAYPCGALRRPRGGPYFLLLQKVGKDRRKGVSPPCESPDQSGVLDAPLWKPPSPRWRGRPGRTPRRFAAGASVPLGKAASACALATAAAPPPLRGGGFAPLPPMFPIGKRLPITRAYWGLRPLAPAFPIRERLPIMRACWGLRPLAPKVPKRGRLPIMRARAWDNVRNGLRATPPQISRKLLPRKRLGVPSLPSRGCGEATLARPQGESQRGRSPLWPVFAYFLLARK